MASEEKLKALSAVRETLRRVEGDLNEVLKLLEPFPAPVIKGWLRSSLYRVFLIRSGVLSYPRVLELARKR